MSTEGGRYLAEGCGRNNSLVRLIVKRNSIEAEGGEAFGRMLLTGGCKSLLELNLSLNHLIHKIIRLRLPMLS